MITKRIIWKKPDGSVARECVSCVPEQVVEVPAVLYAPGEVIKPAVVAAGGELKTPGFIDDKGVIHPAVLFEVGEVITPAVLATGEKIKVPAVMRNETPEEVFTRFLPLAQQREIDNGAGGMEFAGVCDEADDLPLHHEHYFDALEWDGVGKRPKPNLTKSRNLKLNWLRVERNAELEKLDRDQMRVLGNPTELAAVEAKKQKLRDMPQLIAPTLDACADLTALDAVTMAQFKVEQGL